MALPDLERGFAAQRAELSRMENPYRCAEQLSMTMVKKLRERFHIRPIC